MTDDIKTCQSCKKDFQIDSEDFAFYEKVKVPPPTFCPECRLQRRLATRNERSLYKRECGLCKKNFIGMYAPDSPYTPYCSPCWWGDGWDATDYGVDYDFSRPFFEQFFELQRRVPHMGVYTSSHTTMVNSEYTNLTGNLKNCYLIFNADYNEGCAYGTEIERCKDSYDNLMIEDCQMVHECVNCRKCYRAFYSIDCEVSSDIWFSRNLSGCTNCFGCTNLRQKKYHFFNEPLTEEEYKKRVADIQLNPRLIEEFTARRDAQALLFPYKFAHTLQNKNVSGEYIYNSKNVRDSFVVTGGENCRYAMWGVASGVKDAWDWTEWGMNAELQYECMGTGDNARNCLFTRQSVSGIRDAQYSLYCVSSGNLFGCISVRKNEYCILNKKYSKEEYEALVPRIIEHMKAMPYQDSKGRVYRYGEFFPIEHSQFAYNETNALEHFPLTREEALAAGYRWREKEIKTYSATLDSDNLPDIKNAADSITGEIIACGTTSSTAPSCTGAFRIIPQELAFYRHMNLPLPHFCPNCRHAKRLTLRNPIGLYARKCMCVGRESAKYEAQGVYRNTAEHAHGDSPCPNGFETPYPPERPEIVYCESCYQAEVV